MLDARCPHTPSIDDGYVDPLSPFEDVDALFGLEMKQPWADLVVSGAKTMETRAYALPPRLLGKPVALLRTPAAKDGEARLRERAHRAAGRAGGDADGDGPPADQARGLVPRGPQEVLPARRRLAADRPPQDSQAMTGWLLDLAGSGWLDRADQLAGAWPATFLSGWLVGCLLAITLSKLTGFRASLNFQTSVKFYMSAIYRPFSINFLSYSRDPAHLLVENMAV